MNLRSNSWDRDEDAQQTSRRKKWSKNREETGKSNKISMIFFVLIDNIIGGISLYASPTEPRYSTGMYE
jgi:hypothetical protein